LFLYTKPTNKNIFTSLFFYPIVETSKVLFMENKKNGISDFLKNYSTKKEQGVIGSLVMNCNPFTLGHQYVIEKASKECKEVYVFVLSEESDGFSANDRFQMVKRGTCHLKNVTVLKTGPYLISSATFPTYFLKDRDSVDQIFCEVDIEIFAQYFVPYFGITRRYVGTEPLSPMTDKYNDALKKILSEKSIEFIEVSRKENQGIPISASEVRRRIKDGDISSLDKLVPASTLEYLLNNNLI
jgi:[citrate (pro-3S)-lyase] ligase